VLGSVLVWVATLRFCLALVDPLPVEAPTDAPAVVDTVAVAPS
jgi:hypothetical protein